MKSYYECHQPKDSILSSKVNINYKGSLTFSILILVIKLVY